MRMTGIQKVFDISDYRAACKFLQEKYDKLGYARKDYFHITGEDNHLTKTSGIGRGSVGLQYHHICEDIVPSLSNKDIAVANPIEYQNAENMCYCNLLEHAWLHILITENNTSAADSSEETITGVSGVRWMLLALNSIMCNADISWYSSKNEEGKGCDYNIGNVITDNRDQYLKVINRFCTSVFIRQRLNKTPKELAEMICITCKKDGSKGGLLAIYSDILSEATKTSLFDWNVNAYADLENYLKANQSALVYICTGGGKTTTGLEYLRIHGGHALALGPSDTIKDGWDKDKDGNPIPNVTTMNYQAFMNCYDTLDWDKYTMIFADEAHHVAAERWGEGLRWVLANRPEVKIIGLTATPTKEQFDGSDEEFGGRICYGLDLARGIESDRIYKFSYVTSIYKMEDVKDEFERIGGLNGTLLWGRLNIKLNENPIEKILKKHMPEGQRKIIVFCSSTADIEYAKEIMLKYDPALDLRIITSKEDKKANTKAKKWFNGTTNHNVCLVTVDMVNEGAHYDGINTLIMFRRTNSATLYLQQLGRIVVTKYDSDGNLRPNPHGIVFDFTNNAENLIYNSTVSIETTTEDAGEPEVTEDEKADIIKKIKTTIKKFDGTEIIHKDYTEDCVKTLTTLMEAKNTNRQSAIIYTTFADLKKALTEETDEYFQYDLWVSLKTDQVNLTVQRPRHATSTKTDHEFEDALNGKRAMTKTIVKASEVEKIATAFRTAIRRLYNFGYIEFADKHACTVTITNRAGFERIIRQVGFNGCKLFENVMNRLEKHTFLIATNLD